MGIMPDINAQRDLFMFKTTVVIYKCDILSHRILGNSHGMVFRVLGSSQST
jgi:hypothetical protein